MEKVLHEEQNACSAKKKMLPQMQDSVFGLLKEKSTQKCSVTVSSPQLKSARFTILL